VGLVVVVVVGVGGVVGEVDQIDEGKDEDRGIDLTVFVLVYYCFAKALHLNKVLNNGYNTS
jgi:hypothetical protein